nr:hypothetical protein [uncultured Fluviicola sp.]
MKTKNFLANFWFKMSPIERLIFIIVIAVLAYLMYKYVHSRLQTASQAAVKKGEIDALKASGQKANYTDPQYKTMANDLYEAMDGPGTDDELLNSTFKKLKSDIDFVKLESAFGVREASDNLFGYMDDEDLSGWIKGDLNPSEISKLDRQLKAQNLTYQF